MPIIRPRDVLKCIHGKVINQFNRLITMWGYGKQSQVFCCGVAKEIVYKTEEEAINDFNRWYYCHCCGDLDNYIYKADDNNCLDWKSYGGGYPSNIQFVGPIC